MSWVWMLLAIASEVTGTLSMRASDGFRKKRWLIPIALCYLAAFTFLGLTLSSGMHVGVAYGLWTAIGIVLVAVAARVIWKDLLTRRMLVGIGLIVIGVVLIEAA